MIIPGSGGILSWEGGAFWIYLIHKGGKKLISSTFLSRYLTQIMKCGDMLIPYTNLENAAKDTILGSLNFVQKIFVARSE